MTVLWQSGHRTFDDPSGVTGAVFAISLLLSPAASLVLTLPLVAWLADSKDRVTEHAVHFEGELSPVDRQDPTIRALVKAGVLSPEVGKTQWVDLLPATGRLLSSVTGAKNTVISIRQRTTAHPSFGWTLAAVAGGDGSAERPLSSAEQEDLLRHSHNANKNMLIGYTVFLAGWLIAWFAWGHGWQATLANIRSNTVGDLRVMGFGAGAFWLLVDLFFVPQVFLLLLLAASTWSITRSILSWKRDVAAGRVQVWRLAGPEGQQILETLPSSRRTWSVDGKPSIWRRMDTPY